MSVDELPESKKLFLKVAGMWLGECQRMPAYSRLKRYLSLLMVDVVLCVLQVVGILAVFNPENIAE